MANGVITWNGVASDTLGIIVRKVPGLNRPQRKHDSYSVPGRNGNIVVMQDAFAEYEQEYEIFTLDGAQADARAIVDWLYQDGWCKLSDDWEPDYYRLAYFVGPVDIEPIMDEATVCTITFRCKPQRYLVQTPRTVASGTTLNNPTDHIALPIFTLTGTGTHSMYDLTRSLTTTNYGAYWFYKDAFANTLGWVSLGTGADDTTVVSFYSQTEASSHSASISTKDNSTGTLNFTTWRSSSNTPYWGVGTAFDVTANADYTISCTAGYSSKVVAVFFSGSGIQPLLGIAEASRTGSGKLSLTFHTPAECGHVLIFFHPTNGATATFSSIMLVQGTEEQNFQAYMGSTPYTVTLGDTSLQFYTNGFNTAVIDCERENISINGVDSNYNSNVLDKYGNISPEYLRFKPGNSVLMYSSDIASFTVDTRIWEL